MTGLDWIILSALVLFTLNGYRIGLVKQLFIVVRIFASYYIARLYAKDLAPFLVSHVLTYSQSSIVNSLGYAIAFALLFLVAFTVLKIVGSFATGFMKLPILSFVNKLAGAAAGLVFVVAAGSIIMHILFLMQVPALKSTIAHSLLAHSLLTIQLWPLHGPPLQALPMV
ncbi:MAG: Colicin production protein [Bacilli bacterium]|nr:Colicin production protein [Bacilli bacterium]